MFQKDQTKTVGGVKGTRYLHPIHFCYIRTQTRAVEGQRARLLGTFYIVTFLSLSHII